MLPLAGAVEIPVGVLIAAVLVVALGPPLAVSLVATLVHGLDKRHQSDPRLWRTFLKWFGITTAIWVGLLFIRIFLA